MIRNGLLEPVFRRANGDESESAVRVANGEFVFVGAVPVVGDDETAATRQLRRAFAGLPEWEVQGGLYALRATPGVLAALRHFERHEDRACEVTLTPLPTTHRPPAALDLPSESL